MRLARPSLLAATATLALAAPAAAQATSHDRAARFGAPTASIAAAPPAQRLTPDPTTAPGSDVQGQPVDVALSNETTRTVWGHSSRQRVIYTAPDLNARRIGHLRLQTEDWYPEVYLVLSAHRDATGRWWLHLRLPGRPNGRTGWVVRDGLGALRVVDTELVVNRRTLRATLFVNGRRVWRAPVGVGKPSTPTPPGHFWVREGFSISGRSAYGPYAFGTSDYSVLSDWPGGGVVGIHGDWFKPQLIPGRPSHGCIRMHNGDIRWLSRQMPIGTPVRVL